MGLYRVQGVEQTASVGRHGEGRSAPVIRLVLVCAGVQQQAAHVQPGIL